MFEGQRLPLYRDKVYEKKVVLPRNISKKYFYRHSFTAVNYQLLHFMDEKNAYQKGKKIPGNLANV